MRTITTLLILMLCNLGFGQISKPDFEYAMKLLQGNNPEKALAYLENLEKKIPTDAKVLFLRGFYQFRDGNQNGAMMSFSNAIKTNPKFAFAYGGRAQLFAAKGMFDRGILDISEAIKLEPNNADYVSTRASFYNETKQFVLGLEDMKTKIKLDPNSIMGYFDAAVFAKSMDANYNSDAFFNQAYANKGIQKFVVDFMYAKFLMNAKRFDEAKPVIEASLVGEKEFDGDDLQIPAIIFYKTKDYQKSLEYFQKAIAKKPGEIEFRCNMAAVYSDLKNWQKVKETAEGALALDPNNPMSNMYMAVGLKWTGNESQALEYEAKAKRLDAEQNK